MHLGTKVLRLQKYQQMHHSLLSNSLSFFFSTLIQRGSCSKEDTASSGGKGGKTIGRSRVASVEYRPLGGRIADGRSVAGQCAKIERERGV